MRQRKEAAPSVKPVRSGITSALWFGAMFLALAGVLALASPANACPYDPPRADVPQSARDHICGAWNHAGNHGWHPGTALNESHPWGRGYIRDFDGGYFGRGGIMERHGIGWAYVVGGSWWQTYLAVGGAGGPLGYPRGRLEWAGHLNSGPRGNQYMTFEGGVVNKWAAGTFATWGAILERWNRSGNATGALGLPTSNEGDTIRSPQGTPGRYSRFEHGVINYNPRVNGAFVLFGAIGSRYAGMGYSGSYLGLPVSDEFDISGGKRQNFEGGYLFWRFGFSYALNDREVAMQNPVLAGPTPNPQPGPAPQPVAPTSRRSAVNGCGPRAAWGLTGYLVPDRTLIFNFKSACDSHDRCYARRGVRRYNCDLAFLRGMRATCLRYRLRRAACLSAATAYYVAVRALGGPAFSKAQRAAR